MCNYAHTHSLSYSHGYSASRWDELPRASSGRAHMHHHVVDEDKQLVSDLEQTSAVRAKAGRLGRDRHSGLSEVPSEDTRTSAIFSEVRSSSLSYQEYQDLLGSALVETGGQAQSS